MSSSSQHETNTRAKSQASVNESTQALPNRSSTSSLDSWSLVSTEKHITVPTFAEMKVRSFMNADPTSVGERVWALAQQCQGLSGRELRRLPVLGWTEYNGAGQCSLADAISALEDSVEEARANNTAKGLDVDVKAV